MSIAGGVQNAILQGQRVGCTAIQIFTKNSNQWGAKPIGEAELDAFRKARTETGIEVSTAHCAYLINLASPEEANRRKGFESLKGEVSRAATLEIPYLVLHPGSHTGSGADGGVKRIADAINEIHAAQESKLPSILLECMAGQGSSVGSNFEELARILELVRDRTRIGFCLDTCHLFAAGYDIRTPEGFADVLERFDKAVGLEWVKAFHLNDSKKDLGCRVDRHEHIGKGFIGLEAFRYLLNHPRFIGTPMLLETPKGEDDAYDLMNLAALRGLIAGDASSSSPSNPQTESARSATSPR